MTRLGTVLLLGAFASLSRSANIDFISRMDRSLMPYSGASRARNPYRRYRYPIYTKRSSLGDELPDELPDPSKRFLRGMSLRPLSVGLRDKRLHGVTPRYDISMTPYDLEALAQLHLNGRKKRTPDLYDLKRIYKVYEAGRKKSLEEEAAEAEEEEKMGRERRGGDISHALWNAMRLEQAGKRSPVTSDALWNAMRLEQAGKRSPVTSDALWNAMRLEQAGKRSPVTYYDLIDMDALQRAGKRSVPDSYSLWRLAQMHQAGKRSIRDYDILELARLADAGKRSGQSSFLGPYLASMDGLYAKRSEEDDADSAGEEESTKKKRSFGDYFGWDRKKKSVGEDAMVNDYLKTMQKEVLDGAEKHSTSGDIGVVNDDED